MRLLKLWLPVVLWSAVILSAANDAFSSGQTRGWLSRLFGGDVPDAVNFLFRKGGHIASYGLLAALTWRADRRPAAIFGVVLAVAAADEILQAMTATRSGSVADVLLDLFGAALAVLALRKWSGGRFGRRPAA